MKDRTRECCGQKFDVIDAKRVSESVLVVDSAGKHKHRSSMSYRRIVWYERA